MKLIVDLNGVAEHEQILLKEYLLVNCFKFEGVK